MRVIHLEPARMTFTRIMQHLPHRHRLPERRETAVYTPTQQTFKQGVSKD